MTKQIKTATAWGPKVKRSGLVSVTPMRARPKGTLVPVVIVHGLTEAEVHEAAALLEKRKEVCEWAKSATDPNSEAGEMNKLLIEIGKWSVDVAKTGELAPSSALIDAVTEVQKPLEVGRACRELGIETVEQLKAKVQPDPRVALLDTVGKLGDDAYLLCDSRSTVGDAALFWREGRRGYTARIDEAHVFTKLEAFEQHQIRASDVPVQFDLVKAASHSSIESWRIKSIFAAQRWEVEG